METKNRSFDEFVWALEKKWIEIVCILGVILVPLFGGLDYFIIPKEYLQDNLSYFFTLRGIATGIALVQLLILKFSKPNPWNAIHAYVFTFVVGGIITLMTTRLGGFESSYYAGLNLVLIAINLFLPWNAWKGALNSFIIVLQYVLTNLAFDTNFQVISIINNLYFMLGTIIISVTIAHFKFSLTKSEFEKMNLISNLKSQQDGDYFLTSLVLKPLSLNLAKSDTVSVEFYTSQKKKFTFKTWNQEIGGDICVSNVVRLQGKRYVVFVNADAMGKSLQGAGGAIVFGAVFHALVQRTKMLEANQNQYPERWLKSAIIELQKTFESFDGAMMISMVIGLVDEESGLVYYINAEHPFPVLYRDGKASFIDSQIYFRKIGMLGIKSKFFVSLFQMSPGDVILLGSDGREDLMVWDKESNSKNMIEDENIFLQVVEKGNGNLTSIVNEIKKSGEIIDDLSLLKISFQPKGASIKIKPESKNWEAEILGLPEEERFPIIQKRLNEGFHSKIILKEAVTQSLRRDDMDSALEHAKQIVHLYPAETKYLYFLAKNHCKRKNYSDSIEFGERFRYRHPGHVKNLLILSDSYRRIGNTKRAEILLQDVFAFEPENEVAMNLLRRLKNENGKDLVKSD
ncbi:stage II sporulation protein E [Leptospira perolatii]|uniref:Stage II sporulation protein E n=1 Tax=Leptospira perolatii TaxID=2023191 RepID=A0A2M9ZQT5_9LEPT|nr:PP2C family protein-serine/threonine phosphatase [Leptospira perolatii]PJZ70495.1 stage II sporulation protein E [Leptospira perolatii]PJZ74331.1 stage II sporulation protein E [Leptospira perolatii]